MTKLPTHASKENKKTLAIRDVCYHIAMILIVALAAFLRFYKLTVLPYGIHIDEAGLGVNAYALANFGMDRYLNSYPIYPENFGGGQSPFYSYLVAFLSNFLDTGIWIY